MEFKPPSSTAGQNCTTQSHPRQDKHQPIIIQNFELLTRNQLKFKKKALSTANLVLSSASLSRQSEFYSRHLPGIPESPEPSQRDSIREFTTDNFNPCSHQTHIIDLVSHQGKPAGPDLQAFEDRRLYLKKISCTETPQTAENSVTKNKLWITGHLSTKNTTNDINNNTEESDDEGQKKKFVIKNNREGNEQWFLQGGNQDGSQGIEYTPMKDEPAKHVIKHGSDLHPPSFQTRTELNLTPTTSTQQYLPLRTGPEQNLPPDVETDRIYPVTIYKNVNLRIHNQSPNSDPDVSERETDLFQSKPRIIIPEDHSRNHQESSSSSKRTRGATVSLESLPKPLTSAAKTVAPFQQTLPKSQISRAQTEELFQRTLLKAQPTDAQEYASERHIDDKSDAKSRFLIDSKEDELLSRKETNMTDIPSFNGVDVATVYANDTGRDLNSVNKETRPSKKVSFNLPEKGTNDEINDKDGTVTKSTVKIHHNKNQEQKTKLGLTNRQFVQTYNESGYLIPQLVDASAIFNSNQSEKLDQTGSVRRGSAHASAIINRSKHTLTTPPLQNNNATPSKFDTTFNTKTVRSNFLKAEFESSRKFTDLCQTTDDREEEQREETTKKINNQIPTSQQIQKHKPDSDLPENDTAKSQNTSEHSEVLIDATRIKAIIPPILNNQAELNASFLMQNYSPNGDRQRSRQSKLRLCSEHSGIGEGVIQIRSLNLRGTRGLEPCVDVSRDRMQSARSVRESKARKVPRFSSASQTRRARETENKRDVLERGMFGSGRTMPERTSLNRRLQQFVLGSLSRSNSKL